MNTILLSPASWDLLLDSSGNIAMATDPYAIDQDVASACKLFLGELYYDNTKGVPYLQDILGHHPSMGFIAAQLELAAESVPEVISANCTAIWSVDRSVNCTLTVTTLYGTSIVTVS